MAGFVPAWTLAMVALAAAELGQVPEASEPPVEEPAEAAEAPVEAAEAPVEAAEAPEEPARCRLPPGGNWLDWLQRNMSRSVCLTALWFDDFFGDARVASEREGSWGRVRGGVVWDEREGVDPTFRLRAKLALPRMERRLHAVLGRDDPDPLSEEAPGLVDFLPEAFGDTEQEWLSGFEYEPIRGDRHDLDLGFGAHLSSQVDPYVRLRYRLQQQFATRWLLRYRVSPFWRDSTRLGVASRVDLDGSLRPGLLLRLSGAATLSERSEGIEWQAGPVLYQRLGESRALAYRLTSEGTTESQEPSNIYGLEALLRQRLHRAWLVLEVGPRLEWRHPSPEEARELVPALGLGLELRFGER